MPTKQYSKSGPTNIFIWVAVSIFLMMCVALSRSGFVSRLFGCFRMSCLEVSKSSQWKLTDIYEETKGSSYRALYTYPQSMKAKDMLIRVDVRDHIETEIATDYIHGRIAGMKALYDNIRSPYPGLLSNEIVCDEAYKPVYGAFTTPQGVMVQYATGYLNDRMTFGSCQKAEAKYKGMMLLFACPKKQQLYQIEFIAENDVFDEHVVDGFARSIMCL